MRKIFVLAAAFCCAAGGAAARTPAADALFAQGRFAQAKAAYAAVSPASADYAPALRRMGAIALYQNRLAEAERDLLAAYSRNPADKNTAKLLAEIANRQGAFAKCAVWLRRAGDPQRAAAFAAFGNAQAYRIVSSATAAEIPFVQTDPLPAIRAGVNGHEGLFLIDTGGGEAVLDPAFAAAAGVKRSGGDKGVFAGGKSATVSLGRISRMSLGAVTLADVPAGLVPTSGFSNAAHGKAVAGVIGVGLLSRFLSTIDYPGGKLVLAPKDSAPQPGIEIPFWLLSDHLIVARGRLDGGPDEPFIVDTGLAGSAFTAPRATLAAAHIPVPELDPSSGGAIGTAAAVPFPVASLSLGALKGTNLQGLYGPFPPALETGLGVRIAGIVSHSFFRPYAITFDFTQMRIIARKPEK